MTYPTLATVNATTDLTPLLTYWNTITNGLAMPLVLACFFLIIFFGTFFAQLRFSGRIRPETSFTAASFASVGLAVILSSQNGILDSSYIIITGVLAVVGVAWLYFSPSE